MRSLTYLVAVTLDGFIAGSGETDASGMEQFWTLGEDYLGRLIADYPETLPGAARAALGVEAAGTTFDTVLEGRRSYQTGLDVGVADAYPHLRHVVFSRTLTADPETAVEVVDADPVATVRELKQQDGLGLWLVGGGTLAGALYDEIDRVVLKLNPVTLGDGLPLFVGATFDPVQWQRTAVDPLPGGVTFLTFDRIRG